MGKVIFTITTAMALMLGQVYDEKAATVSESVKTEKIAPAAKDSVRCNAKKELRNAFFPNQKQLPS